jgi:hypothetical protein
MASGPSVEGSLADGSTVAAPEDSGAAPMASAGLLKSTDGLVRLRAKTFGGTVVCPDAILASSSTSSLYFARDVVELEPVELVFEATHHVAVRLHLLVVAAGLLHHLIDDKLGVSPDVEALDAKFDGDAEAAEEGLVLRHIVGRREVQVYHVAHVLSER